MDVRRAFVMVIYKSRISFKDTPSWKLQIGEVGKYIFSFERYTDKQRKKEKKSKYVGKWELG